MTIDINIDIYNQYNIKIYSWMNAYNNTTHLQDFSLGSECMTEVKGYDEMYIFIYVYVHIYSAVTARLCLQAA